MGQKRLKTVALVPARGGSKGIPRKNIRAIAGQPLIHWTCRAASECAGVDEVFVSTEDPEIARVVRSFGLPKVGVVDRDSETATDEASTESVMLDFADRVGFDRLVLLQATSPLLRPSDIGAALGLVDSGDWDSVLSVVRQKRFIWDRDGKGGVRPVNYRPESRPRRQDFEGFLVENGALYVTSRAGLLDTGCRLNGRIGCIEMDEETFVELDEPSDWEIVEQRLLRRLPS